MTEKIKHINSHLGQLNCIFGGDEEIEGHFLGDTSELFNNYFGNIEVEKQDGDEEGEFFYKADLKNSSCIDFIFKSKSGAFYVGAMMRIERLKEQGYSTIPGVKEILENLYGDYQFQYFIYLD